MKFATRTYNICYHAFIVLLHCLGKLNLKLASKLQKCKRNVIFYMHPFNIIYLLLTGIYLAISNTKAKRVSSTELN